MKVSQQVLRTYGSPTRIEKQSNMYSAHAVVEMSARLFPPFVTYLV